MKKEKLELILKRIWSNVLDVQHIDKHDKFLALGGGSLAAIKVIHKINHLLGVQCSLQTIFDHNTIASLANFLNHQKISVSFTDNETSCMFQQKHELPLTAFQKQIYFFDTSNDKAAIAYTVPMVLEIKGKLNIRWLEKSIRTIAHQHDVFQIFFKESNSKIVQCTAPCVDIKLIVENVDHSELSQAIFREVNRKISLNNAPLMTIKLLRLTPETHYFVVTIHHIITDAWSMQIFKDELIRCYLSYSRKRKPKSSKANNYVDHVLQQENLSNEKLSRNFEYWKNNLVGYKRVTFPEDFKRPTRKSYRGKKFRFSISKDFLKKAKIFSVKNDSSLFVLMSAVLNVLLFRYTGQDDIVIGFPVCGRSDERFAHTMGLFINTLVLRSTLKEDDTFIEFLPKVKQNFLDAHAHQNMPFSKLVKHLNVARHEGKNPIFQVMIVWQDVLTTNAIAIPDIMVTPQPVDNRTAKFDVVFEFIYSLPDLECIIEYDTDLYQHKTIQQLSRNFKNLLSALLNNPTQALSSVAFISKQEKRKLLSNANVENGISHQNVMHVLFEQQARKFMNHIALQYGKQFLTYGDLNKESNKLAHYIRSLLKKKLKVISNTLIGIHLNRDPNLIIAILATLKAGAAYVPLDSSWPCKRLKFVLDDANCELVITQQCLKRKFDEYSKNLLIIDTKEHTWHSMRADNLKNITVGTDLIYVIYTSGTTGQPKGVTQTHDNVACLLSNSNALFKFNDKDVWTLFHSYAFDFSVWEMWGALRFGGCLVIPSYQQVRDPVLFRSLLSEYKVTVFNQTPSAFQLFLQEESSCKQKQFYFRYIIFGGEAFDYQLLRTWMSKYDDDKTLLVNMYGITEITVHATYKFLTHKELLKNGRSNIGTVLPHMQAYVVDSNLNLVPTGIPGELLLGGYSLSPGYLNRQQLNHEKFIANPFNNTIDYRGNNRLYRTGDLVRQLSDSSLEYLGRIDSQLKVKGVRIEAKEVEAALSSHQKITHCLATTLQQGNFKILCAYYTVDKNANTSSEELRSYLLTILPDYMLPTYYIKIDRIPLNVNMKIDYQALPKPKLVGNNNQSQARDESCTVPEKILIKIWKQILHLSQVEPEANFFALGGDSISSVLIVSAARKQGFSFSVSDIFKLQTLRKLAKYYSCSKHVKKENGYFSTCGKIKKRLSTNKNIEHIYPLSALQLGMIYHSKHSPEMAMYLDVFCWYVSGEYDKSIFLRSLKILTQAHPVLRTSYLIDEYEEPIQLVHKKIKIPFQDIDIKNMTTSQQEREIDMWMKAEREKKFDETKAPLFRMTVYQTSRCNFVLGIAFHHSILDGWSVATFISQYLSVCSKLRNNKFLDYSVDWNFSKFIELEKEAEASNESQFFWRNELDGVESAKLLTSNFNFENCQLGVYKAFMSLKQTQRLTVLAKMLQVSLDEVILTANLKLLQLYSNQDDVVMGVVFNGRPPLDGIDSTLGLFLNVLPFKIHIKDSSWRDLILAVSRKKKLIYPHRRYPFAKISEKFGAKNSFDSIFYFTNFHVYDDTQETGFRITDQRIYERTNFAITFNCEINPISKKLELFINYHRGYYNCAQVKSLASCFKRLLSDLLQNINHLHNNFIPLNARQQDTVLNNWNDTNVYFKNTKPLHELVADMAEKFRSKIAIISDDIHWSYNTIHEHAKKFAHYVYSRNKGKNKLVALYVERNAEAIIAILGILQSGHAYVPIDITYPKDRVSYIINDAACDIIVTQKPLRDKLPRNSNLIYLEDFSAIMAQPIVEESLPVVKDDDLAYLIYTSGSTGKPKGVMVEHRSLTNLLLDMQQRINFTYQDKMLALTSFSFDISLLELFLPLISGGCCVTTAHSGSKDPAWVNYAMTEYGITAVQATPTTWDMLFEYGLESKNSDIKVLCGGEQMPQFLLQKILSFTKSAWNTYGPTETTIWSTVHQLSEKDTYLTRIPIGKPLGNTKAFVLNRRLQLVPVGAVGDLYIAGFGVARGYHKRSMLTKEKFIANPFCKANHNFFRLYKTGDLVRWLPDGNLDCVGRSDSQIKIRGFRIEPGEIEQILQQHNAIKSSAVVLKDYQGEKKLVAFLIANKVEDYIPSKVLREYLLTKLPYYYLPDKYIYLDKLPLTYNEKIDRKKLLLMEFYDESVPKKNLFTSDEQSKLAKIWKNLLSINTVSTTDDFFDLGGNSLITLRLIKQIEIVFEANIKIKDIIENSLFSNMLLKINHLKKNQAINFSSSLISIPNSVLVLKEGGHKKPLFLVHPVGGNVFYYLPFVRLLPNDRPIYGIQDPGLLSHDLLFSNLNDMAKFYIDIVKKYQPKGSYFIAGSSFGANLVVEMARQLKDAGESIAFVGLIDGWARYPKEANSNRKWFENNLMSQFKKMDGYFTKEDLPELFFDLHWHRQRMLVDHVLPNMTDIKLTLFKAKDTMDVLRPLESKYNNWDVHCHTFPEVHLISGDHFTMHFPPHHHSLAQAFRRCLARLNCMQADQKYGPP